MNKPLLIIFTKNPVAGRVKTRLAASTSPDFALEIYQRLRKHTMLVVKQVDTDVAVWYSDHIPDNDIFSSCRAHLYLQKDGNLGEKMLEAFTEGFREGFERIVLIGTDCPELNAKIITSALNALNSHEVVIGPAKDGGYYLIGMHTLLPELFTDITWSTASVLCETEEKLKQQGTNYTLLPVLSDVDTLEDLLNIENGLP